MWDTRTFKSPEEHDAKFPKDAWHSRGTDHELCSAGIRRKMKDKGWMMDINTLEELEAFATKHDTIIIEATGFMVPVDGVLIEIYDDYRE